MTHSWRLKNVYVGCFNSLQVENSASLVRRCSLLLSIITTVTKIQDSTFYDLKWSYHFDVESSWHIQLMKSDITSCTLWDFLCISERQIRSGGHIIWKFMHHWNGQFDCFDVGKVLIDENIKILIGKNWKNFEEKHVLLMNWKRIFIFVNGNLWQIPLLVVRSSHSFF